MELKMLGFQHILGDCEFDFEPVGRPRRAKRLSPFGGFEFVGRRILESRPRKMWR
jgi:hypothetical protein